VYDEPCPWDARVTLAQWIAPRVLELTYTAWDLEPFAKDMGYDGRPFKWDDERRFALRCELDAACMHLYLGPDAHWGRRGGKTYHPDGRETIDAPALREAFPTPRHAVEHIMDSFPIVRRKDETKHSLPSSAGVSAGDSSGGAGIQPVIDAGGQDAHPTERIPDYRTKRVILEIYDEMQRCITSGTHYATILSPSPAAPEMVHQARK
jgi:hypothetical protein